MKINVVLFARVRELVGTDRIELAMFEGATVSNLKTEMIDRYPAIAELLPHCSVSIDHEYSTDELPLIDGCEVGLIPPVSGG